MLRSHAAYHRLVAFTYIYFLTVEVIDMCAPGRTSSRRRPRKKLIPFVFKQQQPPFPETSEHAAGKIIGPIRRGTEDFKQRLYKYRNDDIAFKNEEGTGEDHYMTKSCYEKLNMLSILVQNEWPGMKVRVTEAWDEDLRHMRNSLHYEGRAVDVTTSDRDRSKYGMLARLAVEAGFDFVSYEARSHVHASVLPDSEQRGYLWNGCLHGESTVLLSNGATILVEELQPGDRVLSYDLSTNTTAFSPVIVFLHRDPQLYTTYLTLETDDKHAVTLTENHLVPIVKQGDVEFVFAIEIKLGDILLATEFESNFTLNHNDSFAARVPHLTRVASIQRRALRGVYAPLTRSGTIVVNGVSVSCYAEFHSHHVSHLAFVPIRLFYRLASCLPTFLPEIRSDHSLFWYADLLHRLARYLFRPSYFFTEQ